MGYKEADLVFKTPKSPTGMHITTRPTMHEILRQQRLNYATFTRQFQAKTPLRNAAEASCASAPTASSRLQAKLPPENTLPYH